jgi:hypothetical protein
MSGCRFHGESCWDARLHTIQSYIEAGWGATPMHLIEEALAANGGVLPADPPEGYRDVSLDPEVRRKQKERAARRSAVVLSEEQVVVLTAGIQSRKAWRLRNGCIRPSRAFCRHPERGSLWCAWRRYQTCP